MGSVRGERSVYRESEREFDEAPRRTYTTIKRYQVPEAVSRAVYQEDDEVKDKIVVKRERRDVSRDTRREDTEYRFSEREGPRRDIHYRVVERDSDFERPRSEFRVVDRERSSVRAPSPPGEERERERVFRFERERDFSPARERERERDYDVERYSKSTEYFAQPPAAPQPIIIRESAPQPIIIREGRRDPPIIIREERREPHYEFIEKKEVEETKEETKSLVKREETPDPTPEPPPQQKPEEDYFYERRVVERRRERSNSPEIRPRDSASQYSSDDSYEYVRRERIVDDDGRSRSPHHRRHLAEGAIAGLGAAEIIRRHRKKSGGSGGHRGRDLIGGAAVGALGAEVISRARSMRSLRRGSHSRSRSSSHGRDSRRHHRRRHSSRSHSLSRGQQLGGLAAVAAVGALAGYAINKNRNKETIIVNDRPHRSRSRRHRRRSGHGSAYDDDNSARDPDHRNRRIAQAGLASAAAAGLWEKVRSRSRGGKSRERSRLRTGVPIAAAGLGGAALAGLYEKNKANKEAKRDAIIADEMNRGRNGRSRSRSRNRSRGAPYPESGRGSVDRGMVAYGNEPIAGNDPHGGYYSDEEPGVYRRRRGSSGSSPDTRNRRSSRSRSRARGVADASLAAGAGAYAAHEYNGRRSRSRTGSDRLRHDDQHYNDAYNQPQPYSPPPMGNNAGYNNGGYAGPNHQQPYANAPYFPPPPTGEVLPGPPHNEQNAYPAYNPADYANQPAGQYNVDHGAYGVPRDQQQHPGTEGRRSAGPENVSVSESSNYNERGESHAADGLATQRPRSGSHVHFNLDSNITHSPDSLRRNADTQREMLLDEHSREHERSSRSSDEENHRHYRHHRGHSSHETLNASRSRHDNNDVDDDYSSPDLMHDQYERRPRRHRHYRRDSDANSDGTVELPARFDANGNRRADDIFTQSLNSLLSGHGDGAANLFKSITDGFLSGNTARGNDRDADSASNDTRGRHRQHGH